MKKSIKVLGLAVLAMLVVVSCKNNNNETETPKATEDTANVENLTEDTLSGDTLNVAEQEQVAPTTKKAGKKAEAKEEEKNSVQMKTLPTKKADAKEVAGELKKGEGNSVKSEQTPTEKNPLANKKPKAADAFKK